MIVLHFWSNIFYFLLQKLFANIFFVILLYVFFQLIFSISIFPEEFANSTVAIVPTTTTSTTTTTTATTTTIKSSVRITETITESDVQTDFNNSSTKPFIEGDSWTIHLPIVMGICITIGAFLIIVSLTCRHISNNKDKHHLNRKQNTPLIWIGEQNENRTHDRFQWNKKNCRWKGSIFHNIFFFCEFLWIST